MAHANHAPPTKNASRCTTTLLADSKLRDLCDGDDVESQGGLTRSRYEVFARARLDKWIRRRARREAKEDTEYGALRNSLLL